MRIKTQKRQFWSSMFRRMFETKFEDELWNNLDEAPFVNEEAELWLDIRNTLRDGLVW